VTRRLLRASGFVLAATLGACASSRDPLAVDDGRGGRRLADGEVRMQTRWSFGDVARADLRQIVCSEGRVTAIYDGRFGRLEGDVSESDWRALWRRLDATAPWKKAQDGVVVEDQGGGPYHLVTLRMGDQVRLFSAQSGGGILSFGTMAGRERLDLTNAIVDFVGERATRRVREGPPPEWSAASRPAPAAAPR